jgi:hypothetical protein
LYSAPPDDADTATAGSVPPDMTALAPALSSWAIARKGGVDGGVERLALSVS